MMPTTVSLTGVITPSGLPRRGIAPLMASTSREDKVRAFVRETINTVLTNSRPN